ncbi:MULTISPECIES: hypothetical protein [Methanobacterium]|uniref:TRASH domain-containing protein n=1 Tax=Methanobacterium bryantii TaxID=2161 RepID=A0A2A2H8A2_METBR|nr:MULTISPECIES: hypothetical protein [Methanobacterium]OEC84386.1 hypothetical protein A9507_02275 [Methanobacterium sp. A39]PAV05618.1 hypothetical protein ASJ80_08905 [Methanobacterium bryantii]
MPVEVECKQCGKRLSIKPSRAKTFKYCSQSCYIKAQIKTPMKDKNCEYCGKPLKRRNKEKPNQFNKRKYCNQRCAYNSRIRSEKRVCPICNKEFKVPQWKIKKGEGICCSPVCAGIYKSNKLRETVVCKACGKNFTIPAHLNKGNRIRKFCSHECYVKSKEEKYNIFKKCANCGKEFKVLKSKADRANYNYCSVKCRVEAHKVVINCAYCGKEYTTTKGAVKHGRTMCSIECRNKAQKQYKGSKAAGWKGGISFEPYCHKFNEEFKERVREFWGRKCGICGKTEKENKIKLSVHHCNYLKMSCCDLDIPPLFMSICKSCHGKTNHNREYWEKMLTEYIMIWFDGESYIK